MIHARMRAAVALLMFAMLAAPAAAKPHAPRCVRHHGHRACRMPSGHKAPSAPPLRELISAASASPAKKGRHRISGRARKVAVKRLSGLDGFVAKLGTLPLARTSRVARAADAATEHISADGWNGDATVEIPVHSGETGTDVTATVTIGKGSTDGTLKKVDRHLVADCPDAAGNVSGTAKHDLTTQIETPVPGGQTIKVTVSFGSDATLTGHTATDGTLHDWDQRMTFLAHVQVALLKGHRVIETTPPLVWTTNAAATLSPGADPPLDVGSNLDGPGLFTSFGKHYVLKGWQGQAANRVLAMATYEWLIIEHDAEDDFASAKARHWDTGDCVKLNLSAPKQTLAPSESVKVTSTLGGPSGKGVAPATLTSSATGGAVVTPATTTADSAPLTLTTIAPTTFDPGDSFTVTVNAVSRQGRGTASITFHAAQGTYELRYTHAASGGAGYSYDHSSGMFTDTGNWTESRDVQVSAAVPLTRAADGSFSGSGPVRWDRSAWSQEDDETSNEGQQYPSLCDLDDHETVTATAPGTLTVSSLTLDTQPAATVKLQSLGETWHQNDVAVSGPCPGRTSDYARQYLLGEIGRDHYSAGDQVTWTSGSDPTISLSHGWVAGSGSVVASRTLSGTESSGPDGQSLIPFTDRFEIVRVS